MARENSRLGQYPSPAVGQARGWEAGGGQLWSLSSGRAQADKRDSLRGKGHTLVLVLGWREVRCLAGRSEEGAWGQRGEGRPLWAETTAHARRWAVGLSVREGEAGVATGQVGAVGTVLIPPAPPAGPVQRAGSRKVGTGTAGSEASCPGLPLISFWPSFGHQRPLPLLVTQGFT